MQYGWVRMRTTENQTCSDHGPMGLDSNKIVIVDKQIPSKQSQRRFLLARTLRGIRWRGALPSQRAGLLTKAVLGSGTCSGPKRSSECLK